MPLTQAIRRRLARPCGVLCPAGRDGKKLLLSAGFWGNNQLWRVVRQGDNQMDPLCVLDPECFPDSTLVCPMSPKVKWDDI